MIFKCKRHAGHRQSTGHLTAIGELPHKSAPTHASHKHAAAAFPSEHTTASQTIASQATSQQRSTAFAQSSEVSPLHAQSNQAIQQLHQLDTHVNALRQQLLSNPDTLLDKLLRAAIPSLFSMALGWAIDLGHKRHLAHRRKPSQGFFSGLIFTALSAGVSAVALELVQKSTNSAISALQRRRQQKQN